MPDRISPVRNKGNKEISKRGRKINQKILSFFKPKKNVLASPKTILSKSDFDGIRKPKTEVKFLGGRWSEWKLQRLRAKILKAENSRLNLEKLSLYTRHRPAVDVAGRFFKGLKGMKGKVMLRKAFAMITIVAVIITAYFQNTPYASAATFTLYQTV